MLERFFHIRERDSTVRRELLGGVVTFMTMSYIIFVNPAILSAAGLDFGGALVATCVAAAALISARLSTPVSSPYPGASRLFSWGRCPRRRCS